MFIHVLYHYYLPQGIKIIMCQHIILFLLSVIRAGLSRMEQLDTCGFCICSAECFNILT